MLENFTLSDFLLDGFSNAWSVQMLVNNRFRYIQSRMKKIHMVPLHYVSLEFLWNDYLIETHPNQPPPIPPLLDHLLNINHHTRHSHQYHHHLIRQEVTGRQAGRKDLPGCGPLTLLLLRCLHLHDLHQEIYIPLPPPCNRTIDE